jgi:regulatory protein YycI of two-component signal transduction system YycFG
MAETSYQQLYYPTDDIIRRFKPSLSSYFNVFINAGFDNISNDDINFLANEAVLPGTSYETTQVFGDSQGVTETFANKRVYSPVDVTFYVDYDYKVLRYFESWMAAISPNSGIVDASYNKFNYPGNSSTGYQKEVQITKFERKDRCLQRNVL